MCLKFSKITLILGRMEYIVSIFYDLYQNLLDY
jgi:hypothetical protein